MKIVTALGLAVGFALFTGLVAPDLATAQTCQGGCGQQVKACLQSARTANLGCRLDCRSNAAPGDLGVCMHGCRDTFRTAKTACRTGIGDCLASCAPGGGGGTACLAGCGEDLGLCARNVVTQAKACVSACTSAGDRLSCLADCASAAKAGGEACASDFTTCTQGCPSSPSGAFVE